jgi:hypothetical protein
MTLSAEEIIKEAELAIQVEAGKALEKKAGETVIEILEQRKKDGLDKVAENTTVSFEGTVSVEGFSKEADEKPSDVVSIKSFDKVALDLTALKTPLMALGKGILANQGVRNIAVGSAIGAAGGALANKNDRMGGAIKGGLLGGIGGAAVSAGTRPLAKSIPGALGNAKIVAPTPIRQFSNTMGLTNPATFKQTDRIAKTIIPNKAEPITHSGPTIGQGLQDSLKNFKTRLFGPKPSGQVFNPNFASEAMSGK